MSYSSRFERERRRLVEEKIVEELAEKIWEEFRGRPVTLDASGRPNFLVVRSFARRLVALAESLGLDPEAIDWTAMIDPSLSREENLARIREELEKIAGAGRAGEERARAASELERYLAYLREELERAPPEARREIEEEIKRVEREIEELSKPRHLPPERLEELEEAGRRVREAVERLRREEARRVFEELLRRLRLPAEEVRRRVEYWLKRIPRVYRIDWSGLRARISCHEQVLSDVEKEVERLGGRVLEVRRARRPLVIVYADFEEASPPEIPQPQPATARLEKLEERLERLEKAVERLAKLFEEREKRVTEAEERLRETAIELLGRIAETARETFVKAIEEAAASLAAVRRPPTLPAHPRSARYASAFAHLFPDTPPDTIIVRLAEYIEPRTGRRLFVPQLDSTTMWWAKALTPLPDDYWLSGEWLLGHSYFSIDVYLEDALMHAMIPTDLENWTRWFIMVVRWLRENLSKVVEKLSTGEIIVFRYPKTVPEGWESAGQGGGAAAQA